MDRYVLTAAQLRGLAGGTGSVDAVRLLVDGQVARHRLFLLALVEGRDRLPHATAVRDALDLVMLLDRRAPAAARRLLAHPFLEAWFARLVPRLTGADVAPEPAVGYLGALAAAAAVLGGVDFELTVPAAHDDLVLPMLGTAVGVGAGSVRIAHDGTTLSVSGPLGGTRVPAPFDTVTAYWLPTRTLQASAGDRTLTLTLEEADPYRDRYPRPPLPRLPEHTAARLAALLDDAWRLLVAEQPEHAAAMGLALRALVPVRNPAGAQVSAAARDAFGAIGMGPPPTADVFAELLVHEFQHLKLGALLDLVELCRPDGAARHHAPWRPDPRPAEALLQGAYAFAGVAGFWRTRRRSAAGLDTRRGDFLFAYWREQVRDALDRLLRSGELTDAGTTFAAELSATMTRWCADEVAAGAVAVARLCAVTERVRWRLAHQVPAAEEVAAYVHAWQHDRAAPGRTWAPAVVAGDVVASGLPAALEDSWLTGGRNPALTVGERAVLDGDHDRAARIAAATLTGRDDPGAWLVWAVALTTRQARGGAVAHRRPDLLRAVAGRLRDAGVAADPTALAHWADTGAATGRDTGGN